MNVVRVLPNVADHGGKDPDHIVELCNEVNFIFTLQVSVFLCSPLHFRIHHYTFESGWAFSLNRQFGSVFQCLKNSVSQDATIDRFFPK